MQLKVGVILGAGVGHSPNNRVGVKFFANAMKVEKS